MTDLTREQVERLANSGLRVTHITHDLATALLAAWADLAELRAAAEQVYTAFTVWEDTDMFAVQARATQHLRAVLDKQEGR